MPTYSKATTDVNAMIADRIKSGHYPDLELAEVTISAWFAYAKNDEPPIKLHGEPCAAIIKINSAKDRMEGKADASMTIDGYRWKNVWTEKQKVGLIDHELEHVIVCRSKVTKKNPVSVILSDDNGRPKLKMRLHDIVMGGFSEIAKRHGPDSFEVMIANEIKNAYGQCLFAWGDDNSPGDDMPEMTYGGLTRDELVTAAHNANDLDD